MPLISYSEFVSRVRKQVFPDTDGHLEPINLVFPHTTYVQNALIQAQTYIECLRQNNVQTYTLEDATVNCGVAVYELPDHSRPGAVYAYKPAKGCTRKHYEHGSVNKIMCYVDQFAACSCKDESDICNAVRSGDAVCDNLSLCDDWDAEEGEDDTEWLCADKSFAVGKGKLYVAPRPPCGYRIAYHWEGIKYRYEDADLISDDPDLLDLVSTYVQAERARTFDRDLPLYKELFGDGPSRNGKQGSAWHEKLAAMAHRCREERRIRTRFCSEMWDDSAVSSENIGANLDPVPDRDEAGLEFERCDGCPEGQYMLDGECVECLTPVATLTASDTTLVAGQVVTLSFSTLNVLDADSSRVTLEYEGHSVALVANESGQLSFTPDEDTVYTVKVRTVCGDVDASVSVTVSEEAEGCECPEGLPECLEIAGFDDYTFLDQPLVTTMEQASFTDDIGGPDSDLSGLTYSPETGTVFGIRNVNDTTSEIYEWSPTGTLLRTIETTNFLDTEGICWMYGNTFAISEENPNQRITIVTIEDGDTELDRTDFSATSFATGISAANLGIEGSAYDPARGLLYFTTEKPVLGVWTLYTMNPVSGDIASLVDITASVGAVATDISDLYYDPNTEHLFLLSDESNKIIEITRAGVVVRELALTGFTQPEGLAFNPSMTLMWVASEPAEWARYEATVTACADGNESAAAAWDGTLEQVEDGCVWGFELGTKSYRGDNTSAFILLESCEDDILVYRLQVLVGTDDGADILWSGTSLNSAIGTYERDESLDCGPATLVVRGCDCDGEPLTVAFDPPAGSLVAFPSTVFMTASDETAVVHYTTDGTEPTNNSPIYTGPITLAAGDTLLARAYTTGCIGVVAVADYEAVEGFAFDYLCDEPDRAGVFDVFEANGAVDYHWMLRWGFDEETTVKRLELYETNSEGVWVTGQAWGTVNPIYPAEMDGDPFSVYPLVIDEDGTQLNTEYMSELGTFSAESRLWNMYGQPFVELVGYFKLLFVIDDGEGGEDVIYKLIPHDCYYAEDYYEEDTEPPANPLSANIINVDLRTTGVSLKTGSAAVGVVGDFWNAFNYLPEGANSGLALKWANGIDAGFNLVENYSANTSLSIFEDEESTTNDDPMMARTAKTKSSGWGKKLWFSDITNGTYDVYVFGHGEADDAIMTCRVTTPTQSTEWKSTEEGTDWNGDFVEGKNYVKFTGITFSASEETDLMVEFQTGMNSYVSGIQLVKTG